MSSSPPRSPKRPRTDDADSELGMFADVASENFLGFSFNGRSYDDQLNDSVAKTGKFCAISCHIRKIGDSKVVYLAHDFGFMGGSLGCAEGEKLCLGLEYALEKDLPVVIECRSGGARMQEGTLSLMQMAKVSVAVNAAKAKQIPIVTVCADPCYGGVSASYAMQGDVKIGVKGGRIGFAGPAVILNTMFEMDQAKYDEACPQGFQKAELVQEKGQLDIVLENADQLSDCLASILKILRPGDFNSSSSGMDVDDIKSNLDPNENKDQMEVAHDYSLSRKLDRVHAGDIIEQVFNDYVELKGDGHVGSDNCIRGGLATLNNQSVVVLGTFKGHDAVSMKEANFGMASPAGYRVALRLMKMAEHFGFPVVTLIDTCGAYPSFESELAGQSEALATNLVDMAGLTVPIISLILGEGGSGGALAIGMGNRIGMLSNAYYGVISPEGAASILGRYRDDAHKATQFPQDCQALAGIQKVYPDDLLQLGVIDKIIKEEPGETYQHCPRLMSRIRHFIAQSLADLASCDAEAITVDRYSKFRRMGKFQKMSASERKSTLTRSASNNSLHKKKRKQNPPSQPSRTLNFLANQILNAEHSAFRGKEPQGITLANLPPCDYDKPDLENMVTAKHILDAKGPEAVAEWVKEQKQVLITDTTMRDAHQSLIATRMRTVDMLAAAEEMQDRLCKAFSFEMWGGATFDVCNRFLHESPWERLRLLRKAIPHVLFQMLLRGSNAVGYKSYPDNVVVNFIELAAENGMDVFRIFDCFNDLEQMRLSIETVRRVGKIAEVCICFSGNFLDPNEDIYTLDYFRKLAQSYVDAGAHMICIKDMAGLLRPQMAKPLMDTIRSVTDLPVHYHSHNTSSACLTTAIFMAQNGCDIIDFAMSSLSDTTSQPSLNAFLSSMVGDPRDPGIDFMSLERLDLFWAQTRTIYAPFESGLKCGTARVYEHQIPGGQYSNLIAQARSMGTFDKWDQVLNMYRDVNRLFGDIIKVTPSSKCVGDMALFLISKGLTTEDVRERGEEFEYPASVINLFAGRLSYPHHGLPKDIQAKILKGVTPMNARPGSILESLDFKTLKQELENKYVQTLTAEELSTASLYPEVFDKFIAFQNKYGSKLMHLPSHAFFYGLKLGETIEMQCPNYLIRDKSGDDDGYTKYTITLKRVGPLQLGGMRDIVFELNGERRVCTVKDESVTLGGGCDLPQADPSNPSQIGSPLPGTVEKIYLKPGAVCAKGTKIMAVSAMKMEVQVVAPFPCTVEKIGVEIGDRVDLNTLLASVAAVEPQSGGLVRASPSMDNIAARK